MGAGEIYKGREKTCTQCKSGLHWVQVEIHWVQIDLRGVQVEMHSVQMSVCRMQAAFPAGSSCGKP